jgi:large subunit ribosomal protein L17
VARDIADRAVVRKLFDAIAPRYVERPGGYTRLLRLGYRRGDSAEVALVELIGSEYNPGRKAAPEKSAEAAPDAPKKKSVGGRLREALGGRRKKSADDGVKAKADKTAKGAGKKVTTPRKAGGS